MSLQRWKRIRLAEEIKNPWWTYRKDVAELPSGKQVEYHHVHTNGSSLVMPVLEDGRIVLVRQYRYLCDRESLEFPCGSVKNGSTFIETALEELAEETGFVARELTQIGMFNPYNVGFHQQIARPMRRKNLNRSFSPHKKSRRR